MTGRRDVQRKRKLARRAAVRDDEWARVAVGDLDYRLARQAWLRRWLAWEMSDPDPAAREEVLRQ